jgi:tetratricopeptide (TPR) repeat protein
MQDVLMTAIEMHQSGQLGAASQLYERVLASERENAEALHLLGVLYHQQGEHRRSVELIGQAVALRPSSYIYHANLAEVYRAQGDFERAAGSCRVALTIWPDYPEALCNLGAALQGMARHAEAVVHLRRAIELRPNFVVAHNNLGIALRDLGEVDPALVHFRKAVELGPGFAPARTNLAQTLLNRGQAEEALPHCREAARLDANSAVMHHKLGDVLRILNRTVEARAAYLEALRLNPNLAPSNASLGLLLQRDGQLAGAVVWLQKAVGLEPKNPLFCRWLAELYDELEEPPLAIPAWERVLDLEPDHAGAHLSLGWNFQEEGRFAAAREHFLTAIRLQPDYGEAYLNLGGLHEVAGEIAEAEAAFRTALRVQPGYAIPHARLATLLRSKLPDADLTALEHRLVDPALGPAPRARLLFGLAHALDGRGDHGRAAECLREANATTLALARGDKAYHPLEHQRFVDLLIEAFDRDFFVRLAGAGMQTRRPVFVFGLPRSGTTLVEQVLASHSRIRGAGELRLARRSFESIPQVVGRAGAPRECVAHLDAGALQTLAGRHLESLADIDPTGADRIVDKMPDNYLYLGLLSVLFPHATFIHCRRDLRDVAVSCWMTDFRSIRWASSTEHIAARFQSYCRIMEHWQTVVRVPVHHVAYEETVSGLAGVARRLIAACGLEWEPACLDFHRTERPVRTASLTQVRQPVYQRSVARWKHYEPVLADLFAALALPPGRAREPAREPPPASRGAVRSACPGSESLPRGASSCRSQGPPVAVPS